MPPFRCWIFLTLFSTMTVPDATMALDSSVVAAQPPTPTTSAVDKDRDGRHVAAERAARRHGFFAAGSIERGHDAESCPSPTTFNGVGPDDWCRAVFLAQDLRKHFVLRSEGLHPALVHHQHHVGARKRARAMGDDDDDAAAGTHAEDRFAQRLLALRIEVGIRLVENDEEGIAVERPGKRETLPLAGGKGGPAFADLGLVAVRQLEDEIVDARRPSPPRRSGRASRPRQSGRCSGRRFPRTAPRPAADSRYGGRAGRCPIGQGLRRPAGRRRGRPARDRAARGRARTFPMRSDR